MLLAALLAAVGLMLFLFTDAHAQMGSRVVVEPDDEGYIGSGAGSRLLDRIFSFVVLLVLAIGVVAAIISRKNDSERTKQAPKNPETNDSLSKNTIDGAGQTPSSNPPITIDLARWSVLGTRLYDKVEHKLYPYRLQPDKNLVEVLDETSSKTIFFVEPEKIDVVKISNGIARVKCPKCKCFTSATVKTWVQIKCPRCRFVWQQHLVIYQDK
jgi:phage FluMu protein Com/preprotein translocase subunit SecG